jgi:ribonuclease R
VRRNSALEREARLRATSVYFPSRAVPMLPETLSNGICSLNPQVERLVMSVVMRLNEEGHLLSAEFAPGVILSAERMTYTNVNRVLEGDAEALGRYASLADNFRLMRELALKLNAQRVARGSIDFDLPEPLIEFDELGRMTGVTRSERNIAHRIIEEFMLAANETVARHLDRLHVPSLHRVHEMPDPKRVLEFEEIARTFGYTLGVENLFERKVPVRHGHAKPKEHGGHGRMRPMALMLPADDVVIRPEHYQRLTQKIADKPEERILSYLMLRSLRQARYSANPLGHFALAAQEYTHFTSPIRRYPDLIVHRSLKWALANVPGAASASFAPENKRESRRRKSHEGHEPSRPGLYQRVEIEEIAIESSEAERRADAAERELVEWKTAQFMESHLGEEYDALVISVQKFGFFVELADLFIEGLIPVDRLEQQTGERILYRESDHALVTARRKRPFRIGDRLRVRAERIDPFRRRVEFALAEPEAPAGRSASRSRS